MLKIWGRASSSNVQKVLWCCEELGIPFERIDLGGPFGGNHDPAYLKLNPNGLVPTIEDGGVVIWESNTILRYLAATRGGARLHPVDPVARAAVERWMDWQLASASGPMTTLLLGYYRTPPEKRDSVALEAARRRAIEIWGIVEQQLAQGDYIAGASLSLGDICLGMFVHRWLNFPIERPPLPRLAAYYARLGERPGFRTHVRIAIS